MTVADAEDLLRMSQAELNEIYLNSSVGDIPVGATRGSAIIAPGTWLAKIITLLVRFLIWQGKVFNPVREDLLNKITPLGIRSIRARVYMGDSWLDNGKTIVLDYSGTSFVARKLRDEMREIAPRPYLGKVFLGRRHVYDYFAYLITEHCSIYLSYRSA